jgi:hypothetical protein
MNLTFLMNPLVLRFPMNHFVLMTPMYLKIPQFLKNPHH